MLRPHIEFFVFAFHASIRLPDQDSNLEVAASETGVLPIELSGIVLTNAEKKTVPGDCSGTGRVAHSAS